MPAFSACSTSSKQNCWADVSQKQTALIVQMVQGQGQGNQLMSHQLQE